MPFLECDAPAQVLFAERTGRSRSEVDAHEVLDALVAVLLGCDEAERSAVAGAERLAVELGREEHVGRERVLPDEGCAPTILCVRHEVRARGNREAVRSEHLGQWDPGPGHADDRPRRHAMEVGEERAESERSELRRADGHDRFTLA